LISNRKKESLNPNPNERSALKGSYLGHPPAALPPFSGEEDPPPRRRRAGRDLGRARHCPYELRSRAPPRDRSTAARSTSGKHAPARGHAVAPSSLLRRSRAATAAPPLLGCCAEREEGREKEERQAGAADTRSGAAVTSQPERATAVCRRCCVRLKEDGGRKDRIGFQGLSTRPVLFL
jgi:hypothetical protein